MMIVRSCVLRIVTDVLRWWEMLTVGEVIHELEQGLYGKFLPFTQFRCETKTALKNKAYQN